MAKPTKDMHKDEKTVLVLQGGGALGAYQAGVFEALSENAIVPDWIAGVSIGAINAALIAGNPPARRAERLQEFWHLVSSKLRGRPMMRAGRMHEAFYEASAFMASAFGVPGLFTPRFIAPLFQPDSTAGALSYYDTSPLRETLTRLVDFDLLNNGETRLCVGAVNIKTGNYSYFDTAKERVGPEHIMASAALPPGMPPIKIGNDWFWDGGIVSNAPLQIVLDETPNANLCVIQVDVFSAAGDLPHTIFDVYEREKEIRYSSRTRLNTDAYVRVQKAKLAVSRLLDKLPPELAKSEEAKFLRTLVPQFGTTIVHLIYRRRPYEGSTYDYEFSRVSVEEHWKAGRAAVKDTVHHPAWQGRRAAPGTVEVLDLTKLPATVKIETGQPKPQTSAAKPKSLAKGALS